MRSILIKCSYGVYSKSMKGECQAKISTRLKRVLVKNF